MNRKGIPNWTPEEVEYLKTAWGTTSFEGMARTLNRSVYGVRLKASKLGLGRFLNHGEYVTLNQLYQALFGRNVSTYVLKSWIQDRGMPIHYKKRSNKSRVRIVYLDEFWEWAAKHRSFLDFSQMEEYALGWEPDWVADQRSKDFQKRLSHRTDPWTPLEDQRLRNLLAQNRFTWPEMSKELGRSEGAIARRIRDLKIEGRPIRANPHAGSWTPEAVDVLKAGILNGDPYSLIGQKIGKSEKAVRGYVYRIWNTEVADKVRKMIQDEP